MSKKTLSVQEAAKILGVATKTLHRWEKSGVLIPQKRTSGNHRRYSEEQILGFKEKRSSPPQPNPPLISHPQPTSESFQAYLQKTYQSFSFSSFFNSLGSQRKRILIGSLSLLAVLLILVPIVHLAGVQSHLRGEPNQETLTQQQVNRAVLGEATAKPNFLFNVNVPSFFKQNIEALKDLKVDGTLTAPNLVYSIKAGTGLSISGTQSPTITNTGVTSLQSTTGALTFTAGTGISISGLTITNSSPDTSQNIFKTVKVGSTTFSAGSTTDTLELAAGTGMSLSSDTSNKKVTITASASDLNVAGFTDDGTVVRLSTSTDSVGIGTTSPSTKFEVAGTAQLKGSSSTTGLYVNSSGQVGVGTTNPSYGLDLSGTLNTTGATTLGSTLSVTGAATIAPSTDGTTTSLTVRAASGSTGNILNVTNSAGSTSYLYIGSDGSLTVGGSTLTNAGLLESSGAIHLTSSANTIVGTAIEGGWTLGSNTFTYRRAMTVTNNSGSASLPVNYEITVSLSGTTASQIYSKTQSDGDDFRVAYYNGSSYSEIARNITTYSSSSIVFTFQLQAAIAASGSSSAYYLYYKNSSLSCTSCTYTGNTQLDSADSVSNWSSGDDGYALSQETTIKQEGTGSVKAVAANGNLGTGSTTNQGQLVQTLTGQSVVKATISSTDYAYVLGGNNGTSDQTTVYKSTLSSGNIGAFSTASQGQLPQALSGSSAVAAITAFDGGTGADGTLDLSLGSGAGGCNGTGLSWAGSTCTIATATKSTFNFTTINISSGTTLTTDGPKTTSNFITIKATGNVTVAGTINLDGKGYDSGNGPGTAGGGLCGGGNSNDSQGGAGYGGSGGSGSGSTGGSTYDSLDSGSGGKGGISYYCGNPGGAGGGGIKITSSGTITVSNTITANGNNGENRAVGATGAGSGGRIYLQGSGISVSGYLYAQGGNGGNSTGTYGGGGGGGGRITLEYSSSIDTTGSTISVVKGSGGTGPSGNGGAGNDGVSAQASLTPNLYLIGGLNGSTAQSTVYKSAISGSDLGTFSTTSQGQLPQALYGHSASTFTISSTNYIYVFGGNAGNESSRNVQTTVYKSTIDSSGNVGAFSTTSQTQLSSALYQHGSATATIGSTNYIYILGGLNSSGTAQTTVYKATVDGSANVSAITSTGQSALPQALSQLQAVVVATGSDNYIYAIGGKDSSGNASSVVYKAALDASGNVGTWSATGQGALPQALYGHGAFTASSGGINYVYILGGQNTAVRDTVYKAQVNDMSSYTATKTLSSTNLSNKNDLQWKYYSSATGSYLALEFSEDGSTWQTCSFSISSASTWETKTCDISAIASASRDGVTRLRFRVTSNQTSSVTSYFDDINALTDADTISNTSTAGSAVLGAANLDINAQGTGAVRLNYDASSGLAGTGGVKIYDGAAGLTFNLTQTGDASAAGSLVMNGASSSATIDILDGQNLNIQTSPGGDAGLASRVTLTNAGLVGIGTTAPAYKLDISTSTASDRGLNIAHTGATGTNYGVYSSVTGAATTNYGGYFVSTGAVTNYGLAVAALTGATSTGLDIGNLSGATANKGINIGTISGTGTGAGLTIGAISSTGATNYGLNLGNISGATTSNYGLNLGTLTGGTGSSGYQINTGNITAIASGSWGGINLGTITPTTGTTTYGINIGNTLAGAGTATYGINIGTNASTATTNYGIKIGAISGAGTNNYGLYVDTVSGAGTGNYAAIFAGGNVGIGNTAPSYKLDISTSTANDRGLNIAHTATTGTNYGVYANVSGAATANIGGYFAATGATTARGLEVAAMTSATSTGLTIGALSGTTANTGINIGAISGAGAAGTGITIGNISTTGATNYGINIGNISGATTTNYGINIGTLTGGTGSSVYGISSGTLTSVASGTNFQANLGAVVGATSATFGGIQTGAISGAGTTSYGINLGANSSTATTNYGINVGAISGAGTSNYGLYLGAVSGAGTNNYSIYTNAGTVGFGGNVVANNTSVVSGTLGDTTGGTCGTQSTSTTLALLQTATSVTNSHILYNSTRTKHARITSVTTCTDGAAATWQVITLTDAIASQVSGDSATVYNPVSDLGTSSAGFFNNLYAINGKFVASTATGGFDIAEVYPTTDSSIESGDIVVIKNTSDGTHLPGGVGSSAHLEGETVKSSSPYQKEIIGIVSTNPGITLGDEKDGNGIYYKKVALAGRVLVKVSNESGEIKAGDYLTSSSTPGVSMKATKAGVMVGKALENWKCEVGSGNVENEMGSETSCTSKILVFVNVSWYDPSIYITQNGDLNGILPISNTTNITNNPIVDNQSGVTTASSSSTLTNQEDQERFKNYDLRFTNLENQLASFSAILQTQTLLMSFEASQSASFLSDINSLSSLSDLNATVSGTLMVLGRTILSDLGVTGKISAGLLSINGLDPAVNGGGVVTINTVGNLYLQNQGLGGVDILDGKITIDSKGNLKVEENATFTKDLTVKGVLSAKEINITKGDLIDLSDTESVASSSAGTAIIKAREVIRKIYYKEIHSNSLVYITSEDDTDNQTLYIAEKKEKEYFVVKIKNPALTNIKFNFLIINQR